MRRTSIVLMYHNVTGEMRSLTKLLRNFTEREKRIPPWPTRRGVADKKILGPMKRGCPIAAAAWNANAREKRGERVLIPK